MSWYHLILSARKRKKKKKKKIIQDREKEQKAEMTPQIFTAVKSAAPTFQFFLWAQLKLCFAGVSVLAQLNVNSHLILMKSWQQFFFHWKDLVIKTGVWLQMSWQETSLNFSQPPVSTVWLLWRVWAVCRECVYSRQSRSSVRKRGGDSGTFYRVREEQSETRRSWHAALLSAWWKPWGSSRICSEGGKGN